MEFFRVLIEVDNPIKHKEHILNLLSKKLKNSIIKVCCNPACFQEVFVNSNCPIVVNTDYYGMENMDACILDKKEIYFINLARDHKKLLRVIK